MLFVARINRLLLKIENFQTIRLKWIKSLVNFYWLETNLCQNWNSKWPEFTCSACGPFTKYCGRIQRFREIGNLKHLYRNELDKAWFAPDAAYSDSNDLAKRTISDKILKDTAYGIVRNPNYMDIKEHY